MGGEILSQSEIDALLQIYGQEGNEPSPAEREALERVAALVAEAVRVAWTGLGLPVTLEGTAVGSAAPGAAGGEAAEAALVIPAQLGGALRGRLEFRLVGGALEGVAANALGMWNGADSLSPEELAQLAKVGGSFLPALAEGLTSLCGRQVWLEAGEPLVAGGEALTQRLADAESWARLEARVGLGEARGTVETLWPLEEARQFLSLIGERDAEEAETPAEPAEEPFAEVGAEVGLRGPLSIDLLLDVPLTVTVELGRTERPIKDILALAPGSVVELDRLAGEAVDVMVNGRLIARGEVVVVDDRFGVRVTDIVSRAERLRRLA